MRSSILSTISKTGAHTMSLSHFDPLTNFRVFEDAFARLLNEPQNNRPWSPAVDIYETENELVLKADLPDVDPANVEVQFENGTLTLKGNRKFEEEKNGKGYHRIERSYGSFVRAFSLPETVDPEKVKADFKNGVLTVTMQKKEIAKPRPIPVHAS